MYVIACDRTVTERSRTLLRMASRPFADHFSGHSALYAKYRPQYPELLYEKIFKFAGEGYQQTGLAVDIGCGSGQATISLVPYFRHVIGVDPSPQQLEQAPRIQEDTFTEKHTLEYRCAKAEDTGLQANSADMITVATAVHWFDLSLFWKEADRLLRPGGILAVWTLTDSYLPTTDAQAIRGVFEAAVKPYWSPVLHHITSKYAHLELPYERQQHEVFSVAKPSTLEDHIGYLRSWSPWRAYVDAHPESTGLLDDVEERLRISLGLTSSQDPMEVRWEIGLRMAQKPQ